MIPDTMRPWDAVIVGAGPVGLLLASELAAQDLRVTVFESAAAPSPLPKANGIVGQSALDLAGFFWPETRRTSSTRAAPP